MYENVCFMTANSSPDNMFTMQTCITSYNSCFLSSPLASTVVVVVSKL